MPKRVLYPVLLAFVLWTLMFSPWTKAYIPFWWGMTVSALLLIGLSLWLGKPWSIPATYWRRDLWIDLALGVAIAVVLWGVFWLGDKVSQWLFPSFARGQVDTIYDMKTGWSRVLLSLLLLFVIGPAEEIFWRRYIQGTLGNTWVAALVTLAAYTLVHLFSLNFMLIMAAMVCGIAWGGLYKLMPQRFGAVLISHALWDAAVFIWFPI